MSLTMSCNYSVFVVQDSFTRRGVRVCCRLSHTYTHTHTAKMGKGSSKLKPQQIDELVSETKFTSQELQQWYKAFTKDCPSGLLDKDGFADIYRQFFPEGDAAKFAEYVFNTFDKDGDGTINFREFMCALSVTARGDADEKLDWAFSLYDLDNDGFITKEEMTQIVASIYRMVSSSVKLPDDESTPEKRVDKIFAAMDKNSDGKLTKEEFREGARQDSSIMQALSLYDGLV
ncbi:frequenin-1 [Salpingoeca rosetta]|uniref:Frequenin-1 n=1 Tax=Salpingoeca rosetta (strain ATCC 50818 / BSB-021) TaxID=946362 RepID=F2UR99_SALR5|nr:frequenin-1 [Salpingoeca rosetta]EGD80202.1 frequenin-1 [Salpingoeca rosetta]|eukprot:XP_004988264.1 frequenin-1 [Salpingoeca rosetta]